MGQGYSAVPFDSPNATGNQLLYVCQTTPNELALIFSGAVELQDETLDPTFITGVCVNDASQPAFFTTDPDGELASSASRLDTLYVPIILGDTTDPIYTYDFTNANEILKDTFDNLFPPPSQGSPAAIPT